MPKVSCSIVIPARIASSRLPAKMLKPLCGKPVVQHVIERTQQVRNAQGVYVVSDCDAVVQLAQSLGACGLVTSPHCCCGTERIASALDKIQGDWILDVQGDEPFVDPHVLEALIDAMQTTSAGVLTLVYPIKTLEDLHNPSVVKVVRDEAGHALYFSRSPIPYIRDCEPSQWLERHTFWGHCGIYGFRREVLKAYPTLSPCALEKAESLEQLRLLVNGYHIATIETKARTLSIDTADDLAAAEALLANA